MPPEQQRVPARGYLSERPTSDKDDMLPSKSTLLCVGNGCFTAKDGRLLIHRHTGVFLSELSDHFENVLFMQVEYRSVHLKTLNDFSLGGPRVDAVAIPMYGEGRLARVLSYLRSLPLIFRQIRRADCVYVFMPGLLSRLVAVGAVVWRRPYGIYLRGERGMQSLWTQWVISRANFVLANGGILADRAGRLCSDVDKTVPMFDLTVDDCFIDRQLRTSPPWRLLYVGRVERQKGIEELFQAAIMLRERGIEFELDIVGDGDETERIREESVRRLEGRIRVLGLIADRKRLFQLYGNADLFVFPSHAEGFPRVLYEAMVFGTPIVTTFVGSIGSLMQDNVNCLKVEVGDAVGLAHSIETALTDVDLRRRIADNGNRVMRRLLRENSGCSHSTQVHDKVMMYVKRQ